MRRPRRTTPRRGAAPRLAAAAAPVAVAVVLVVSGVTALASTAPAAAVTSEGFAASAGSGASGQGAVVGAAALAVPNAPTPPIPPPIVPPDPAQQPPTQPAPTQQVPQQGPAGEIPPVAEQVPGASGCGVFDMAACISEALTGLLRAVSVDLVNAALDMLSDRLLQTPRPSAIPRVADLWSLSWRIAAAVYTAVVLLGGLIVMAYQSVQTRYGLREIGPRLVVGYLAGWLSLPLADTAVEIANAVSGALTGGLDDNPGNAVAGVGGLATLVQTTITGAPLSDGVSAWPLMFAVTAIGLLLLAVVFGYVVRVLGLCVLVAVAPLVVMWHALPQTYPLARWWWRALAGLVSIQILQSLIIAVGLALLVPSSPDAAPGVLGLSDGSGWTDLLVIGVLLWMLLRVPGWVWSSVKPQAGGPSLVTRTARVVFTVGAVRRLLT